jgi:hypothetical protein
MSGASFRLSIFKNLNPNSESWAKKFEGKAIFDIGMATAQLISIPESVYRHSCQRRDIWMAPAGTPGEVVKGYFRTVFHIQPRFPRPRVNAAKINSRGLQ